MALRLKGKSRKKVKAKKAEPKVTKTTAPRTRTVKASSTITTGSTTVLEEMKKSLLATAARRREKVGGAGPGSKEAATKNWTTETYSLSDRYLQSMVLDTIQTWDPRFDSLLARDIGGKYGVPRGKVLEISGKPETFKSARINSIIAAAQNDPRGALVSVYDTENKVNPVYMKKAGVNLDGVLVSYPETLEQIYEDMHSTLELYLKQRQAYINKMMSGVSGKMSADDLAEHIFKWKMEFPIVLQCIDSVGNAQSLKTWKKQQKGDAHDAPGSNALAHAQQWRRLKNMVGNAMASVCFVNHTKQAINMTGGGKGPTTTTTGGEGLRFNSDIRIEQFKSTPPDGEAKASAITKTRNGQDIIIGRWLGVKMLKNCGMPNSGAKFNHFRFMYRDGFDNGLSTLLALQEMKRLNKKLSSKRTAKNSVIMPDGSTWTGSVNEFSILLRDNKELLAILHRDYGNFVDENYASAQAL